MELCNLKLDIGSLAAVMGGLRVVVGPPVSSVHRAFLLCKDVLPTQCYIAVVPTQCPDMKMLSSGNEFLLTSFAGLTQSSPHKPVSLSSLERLNGSGLNWSCTALYLHVLFSACVLSEGGL